MDETPQTTLKRPDGTAAAQPGEGLSIRRVFTTPGVDPFDTVEWELRDATIGTVFEQREVEFPATWSQNATNIVAQKYFRGQLDSPTRERSVKQMIGRVAGTIARWGRERGYFATDEDGDAFEAELTYVLLHQMAAFNSPVWFNVGFEEQPQCSACQPYHALVSTPEGMVPIGELVEGDQVGREVYDAGGTTRVVAVEHNGRKPVYRVTLRNGQWVEATADHVVKAVRERRTAPQWLRVDQLAPGMRMHLHPHRAKVDQRALVPAGGVVADLPEPAEPDADERVAIAEAALAGWLQADGFVGQYASGTNRSLTLEFQTATDDERDWVLGHLDVAFGDAHRHVRDVPSRDESLNVRRIRLYGEHLRDFVERWELAARGVDIRVPSRLWTASHEEVTAYLASVFQADGYMALRRDEGSEQGRVGFAVIGERWTEDIQLLLNVLGIYSRRRRKHEPRPDRHDMHEVTIAIGSERARFAELIGFVGREKSHKLLRSLTLRGLEHCPDLREEEIVALEPVGVQDVYDIQTESGEYLSNNVAVHNCFILSVDDTMESILDWNTKEGRIFRGGSGSGINLSNIRGSMEPLAKGGTASGPVSFMRGADSWAGTIKSGGKTRRAAKMVVLDVDHPDIREFIWCKANEEDKARALAAAGFDMSLDGHGMLSIQYQNANNSVRVTDEFMTAVEQGGEWRTTARLTGEPAGDPIDARELMHEIADAAWRCADPGVQYDTTINRWHTCPNSGRINASNPCCFVGETLVQTSEGLVRFDELCERSAHGERLPYACSYSGNDISMGLVGRVWVAGMATRLIEVQTDGGATLRCTPEHRFLTAAGEYVEAQALAVGTMLRSMAQVPVHAEVGPREPTPCINPAASDQRVTAIQAVTLDEPVPVYDLEVPAFRNFAVTSADYADGGVIVHNSEYMHVDDSACNLASLNLMKFRCEDGTFDVPRFQHAVDIVFLAQEIIVSPSSYPTERIGANARAFRQLGLGYANLGAYLMADGLPYDSDGGRALAAAITALMTGRAYLGSARIAAAMGPYDAYEVNREAHNAVMRMHRDSANAIPDDQCADASLLAAARESWNEAVAVGERHGYRNAQATVLAPTGTISFLMDCDTTGVEPDFSLVKFKSLVGGGSMTIVNRTVPLALRELGYEESQVEAIVAYVAEHNTIIGAPDLRDEHLPVFDVAVGERAISHMGHIRMMGAVQPFISGAISKTVNLPSSASVEDISEAYMEAWRLGIKALAVYRDGSKNIQVLNTRSDGEASGTRSGLTEADVAERVAAALADAEPRIQAEVEKRVRAELESTANAEARPPRKRMPRERQSITHKFSIGGHDGYITAGMYEDSTVGEIFLTDVGKEGSALRGMMNSFATAISIALQYGVPLETLVEKFAYMRFEPEGITQNPEIPFAKSMPDYIMRWLASRFLDADFQEELGILTPAVRARRDATHAAPANRGDTATPANGSAMSSPTGGAAAAAAPIPAATPGTSMPAPPSAAFTDTPPVRPASLTPDLAVGQLCDQCGGIMQRTGSCYTCPSCGNNTGCG